MSESALDYLESRINDIVRGVPVRDLDEAISAVRTENERLRAFAEETASVFDDTPHGDNALAALGRAPTAVEHPFARGVG